MPVEPPSNQNSASNFSVLRLIEDGGVPHAGRFVVLTESSVSTRKKCSCISKVFLSPLTTNVPERLKITLPSTVFSLRSCPTAACHKRAPWRRQTRKDA